MEYAEYEVTIAKRFPAWNDRPFTVTIRATSKADANAKARAKYRDEFAGDGAVSYTARKVEP